MRNIFKILICLVITNQGNAQIIISDSITKIPIPFVEIYSEKGSLLGTTNQMGEISQELSKKLNLEPIYLYHSKYHSKKCQIDSNKILLLVSNDILETKLLPEVSVVSDKSKYIKLTSYFRSIQFYNKQPQYYMDGIVEYYISSKTSSVKNFILQNRSFKESQIQILKSKGLVQLDFNLVGVPYLDNFLIAQNLKDSYSVIEHENIFDIRKDTLLVGNVRLDSNRTTLNLSINSKNNPLKMKLLGFESNLNDYNVSATFERKTNNFKLKDLNWFKETRQYDMKSKKEKDYSQINTVHEIFVLKKEFVNEKPKSSNSFYTFLNEDNYSFEFWKNQNITPISETIQILIDKQTHKSK